MAFIWQIQGKAILARDFAEKVKEYLCENSNFQRSFIK